MASAIERLPAELRCQILLSLDNIHDLSAMVHSSPIFHKQYVFDRKQILGKHLRATLGDRLFVTAYAVQLSVGLCQPQRLAAVGGMQQFMERYQELCLDAAAVLHECKLDDIVGMTSFYLSTIRPLLRTMPQQLIDSLRLEDEEPLEFGSLSATEALRITRAMYRFQLLCNFCGPDDAGDWRASRPPSIDPVDILGCLFDNLEPWEMEEVACIETFLYYRYQTVFDEIGHDDRHLDPRSIGEDGHMTHSFKGHGYQHCKLVPTYVACRS